jgi:hypothetical protein
MLNVVYVLEMGIFSGCTLDLFGMYATHSNCRDWKEILKFF